MEKDKNKECPMWGEGMMHGKFGGIRIFMWAKVLMMLSIALSVFIFANSYANSTEPGTYRSFSVTGEGKITAVPDIAQFNFSVLTEGDKDIAAIQKENTEKMNKAISFLNDNDIESRDIKTSNYNLSPKYQYFDCGVRVLTPGSEPKPCPPPEIVGYTINQSVTVKIRDFEKIGEVMSGIVSAGANNVSGLNFTIDDRTMVENEARAEAIAKAKVKAGKIAKAGSFRLGKLLSIEEGGSAYYPQVMYSKAMDYGIGGAVESAPAPRIEAGSQDVTVNVVLRYEIR